MKRDKILTSSSPVEQIARFMTIGEREIPMIVEIEVKPKSGTFFGWDVHVMSPRADDSGAIIHKLDWASASGGKWIATTADLPPKVYSVRGQVWLPGIEIEVTARNIPVKEPASKTWPMSIKVDGANQTQNSDTYLFEVTE
jgi:hypothetical protein